MVMYLEYRILGMWMAIEAFNSFWINGSMFLANEVILATSSDVEH